MPFSTELAGIAGAPEPYDRFGRWPQFHDAEVPSPHRLVCSYGSRVAHDRQRSTLTAFMFCTDSSFEVNHQNVLFDLPSKPGTVTVAGHPSGEVPPGTLNNILKQADLK